MPRTTTLTSGGPASTGAIPIRPSDRQIDALPRHATGVIPIRTRREAIVIETAAEPSIRVLGTRADDDLDALEFSAELL